MNPDVTRYIETAPAAQREAMMIIRQLIHETIPAIQEDFKWSRPVFRVGRDLAYFKTTKSALTFGFFDFHKLNDPDGILEGSGKDMRHIKVEDASAVDADRLREWLRALAGG